MIYPHIKNHHSYDNIDDPEIDVRMINVGIAYDLMNILFGL